MIEIIESGGHLSDIYHSPRYYKKKKITEGRDSKDRALASWRRLQRHICARTARVSQHSKLASFSALPGEMPNFWLLRVWNLHSNWTTLTTPLTLPFTHSLTVSFPLLIPIYLCCHLYHVTTTNIYLFLFSPSEFS